MVAAIEVFIALLNYAYFDSIPCMMELYAAIRAKVKIVLVRMEDNVMGEDGELIKRMPPPTANQWKGTMEEEDGEMARMEARDRVGRNAIPHPGTLLSVPGTFGEILRIVREEHCKCDPPTHIGIFEHGSSSEQAAEKGQVKALVLGLCSGCRFVSRCFLASSFFSI